MKELLKNIFTINWLKAAGTRAMKTFFQTAIATIGTVATMGAVNWEVVLGTSLLSALLSVLTSFAGLPELKEASEPKTWIVAAGIRSLKTVAQTAIASVGTATMFGMVDWKTVASASVLAGLVSLATSLSGLPEVEEAK